MSKMNNISFSKTVDISIIKLFCFSFKSEISLDFIFVTSFRSIDVAEATNLIFRTSSLSSF
jgi:hypothetical protein